MVSVARTAFVEGHHYVGAYDALGVDVVLRREDMPGAVDMALEGTSLGSQAAYLREREHLEAAAVGKYRPVPGLEAVETAGGTQGVQAGAQVQVVGVAQDDLGPDVVHEVAVVHPLDGTDRPDGHEYGSMYVAVIGRQHAGAGVAVRIGGAKRKFHSAKIANSKQFFIFAYLQN